jgi:UDP-4-amino-4-deoxy-L-arabinose formyltransferase/UDP-glucuronic acid dehydrogenase (UDP-4-keto-hexauronic acid decarboxylating)
MRLAVLGRSEVLIAAARAAMSAGHQIVLVGTCKAEQYYAADEKDFERLASEAGAPYFCDPAINEPRIVQQITNSGAEIAISWNWRTRIGAAAIAALRHGILNAHAGDLPRYRGNACPNWAILRGESEIGLCVHAMIPDEIDAGDVLVREKMPISEDTYIEDVYAWICSRVPAMFAKALNDIAAGTDKREPQSDDSTHWLRCYPRRPEDGLIDWGNDAETIHRLVRASSRPMAGAYTSLEGSRVIIWRASIDRHPGPFAAVPGQVLYGVGGDPVVACGDGVLRLTEVEVEGTTDGRARILKSLRQRLG